MTEKQARKKLDKILALEQELRDAFPCHVCDGTGDTNHSGGMYAACDACYGRGYDVPPEEDE